NVFFEDGLIKKRYGYSQLGGNLPLSGDILGSDQFYMFDGNNWLLVCTEDDIYRLNTTPSMWVPITTSMSLDKCETAWTAGSGDTIAADSTDYIEGAKSVKITLAAQRSDGDKLAYVNIDASNITAYNSIGFWLMSSANLSAEDLEVVVSESADGAKAGTYCECLSTALTADTWTFVRVAKTLTDYNAVVSVALYANATLASGLVINIDDVRAFTPFTGSDEDFFDYDYVRKSSETDPWWVCTNGVDPIKYWQGGTYYLENLISCYPAGVTSLLCKYIIEFKDHLVLLDVTEDGNRYPQRIRWSDTADPEDFLNGNASYQDLTGADWIVGVAKFKGDYLVVFKERSIWVGYATGDSDIYQFDQKVTGAGCASGMTIESLGDELVFLGWDDVYVFNGIDYEPIGTSIQRQIFANLNPEEMNRCFGVVVEEQKEYWLFVPSTDKSHISGSGVSTYPDIAWCFNYDLNKWTRHEFNDFITRYGYYELESTVTFDELSGTFDQQTWKFDDRTILQSAPTTLLGDQSGYVYEYSRDTNNEDGTAIDGWFSTKDFNPTNLMQRFRIVGLDVYFTGNSLDIDYSTDKGVTWTNIDSLSECNDMTTNNRIFCRLDVKQIRFRIRNNTAGEHFEFSRMNMYWEPSGVRF
ncbi:MAG: hypothetical protein JSV54_02510, partial [Chloroflexota bacterium]